MSAPVSGPGALSQRTDLSQPQRIPTGMAYGDATAMHQQEQASPMAAAMQASQVPPAQVQAQQSTPPVQPPPLFGSGTQRPNEPVTHGADRGPGADSSILTTPAAAPAGGAVSQAIAKAAASDPSGVLQQLLLAAQQRGL